MPSRTPPERTRTDRDALRAAFATGVPLTVRQLSQLAGLSEQAVLRHLEHLMRSVRAEGGRIRIHPAACVACGFEFDDRRRLTKPSRCPACRASRIEPPAFELIAPRGDRADRGDEPDEPDEPDDGHEAPGSGA